MDLYISPEIKQNLIVHIPYDTYIERVDICNFCEYKNKN